MPNQAKNATSNSKTAKAIMSTVPKTIPGSNMLKDFIKAVV